MPNILTDVGKAKIAYAIAHNTSVNLVECAVGDANGTPYTPDGTETSLVHEVWRGLIDSRTIKPGSPTTVDLEATIPYDEGDWYIHEVGFFDEEGDMIAIGDSSGLYKPIETNDNFVTLTIHTELEVTNVEALTLAVDPSVAHVTQDQFDQFKTEINLETIMKWREHTIGKRGILTSSKYRFTFQSNHTYTLGDDSLFVFRGGQLLAKDKDYEEVSVLSIDLLTDTVEYNHLTFIRFNPEFVTREYKLGSDGALTSGKYRYTLSKGYTPSLNNLKVFGNGILLTEGLDYDEIDENHVDLYYDYGDNDNIQFVVMNNSLISQRLNVDETEYEQIEGKYRFVTDFDYKPLRDRLMIFRGILLREGYDYTEVNSNVIDINSVPSSGININFIYCKA